MIAEIWCALSGSGRSRGEVVTEEQVAAAEQATTEQATAEEQATAAPRRRARSRGTVDPARLDQVAKLVELTGLTRYRYPAYDLSGLVQCSREAGLAVRAHFSGPAVETPEDVQAAAFEILQEALANVLKHGDGTATVTVRSRPDRLTLTVTNPVAGRRPEARRSRGGLKRMRRCADRVRASFRVGPHEGGWRVHAEFAIRRTSWAGPGRRADPHPDWSLGT